MSSRQGNFPGTWYTRCQFSIHKEHFVNHISYKIPTLPISFVSERYGIGDNTLKTTNHVPTEVYSPTLRTTSYVTEEDKRKHLPSAPRKHIHVPILAYKHAHIHNCTNIWPATGFTSPPSSWTNNPHPRTKTNSHSRRRHWGWHEEGHARSAVKNRRHLNPAAWLPWRTSAPILSVRGDDVHVDCSMNPALISCQSSLSLWNDLAIPQHTGFLDTYCSAQTSPNTTLILFG